MIAIYQLFKIILGIIISVFILYLLIFFVSGYSGLQESVLKATITKNFRDVTESVYFSGNPINFSDFRRREIQLRFDTLSQSPGIVYGGERELGKIRLRVPTLFTPGEFSLGEELLISRSSMRLGQSSAWWEFNFVEALPEMVMIFDVRAATIDKELIKNIVSLFQDTVFFKPDIKFVFCANRDFVGEPKTRNHFKNDIDDMGIPSTSSCRKPIGKNQRLVTISNSCNSFPGDVCLTPPNPDGVGTTRVKNSETEMVYMIEYPYSVVALIIGGDEENVGGVAGEMFYNYTNEMFLREIELASRVLAEKSNLVSKRIQDIQLERRRVGEFEFPEGSDILRCKDLHSGFATYMMNSLNSHVKNIIRDNDYNNINEMRDLVTEINTAGDKQSDLINSGCEYRVE